MEASYFFRKLGSKNKVSIFAEQTYFMKSSPEISSFPLADSSSILKDLV